MRADLLQLASGLREAERVAGPSESVGARPVAEGLAGDHAEHGGIDLGWRIDGTDGVESEEILLDVDHAHLRQSVFARPDRFASKCAADELDAIVEDELLLRLSEPDHAAAVDVDDERLLRRRAQFVLHFNEDGVAQLSQRSACGLAFGVLDVVEPSCDFEHRLQGDRSFGGMSAKRPYCVRRGEGRKLRC